MTKWEELEDYLFLKDATGEEFNCIALAADLGIETSEATQFIQSYLKAQRHPNSRTLFVLTRAGRTRAAVWHVGTRATDVRGATQQCLSDMSVKVTDALEPDLRRMVALNPRSARLVTATTAAFVANLELLAAGVSV